MKNLENFIDEYAEIIEKYSSAKNPKSYLFENSDAKTLVRKLDACKKDPIMISSFKNTFKKALEQGFAKHMSERDINSLLKDLMQIENKERQLKNNAENAEEKKHIETMNKIMKNFQDRELKIAIAKYGKN